MSQSIPEYFPAYWNLKKRQAEAARRFVLLQSHKETVREENKSVFTNANICEEIYLEKKYI
jgi:hypothetical protein